MSMKRMQEAADWWLRLREPGVEPRTIDAWMRWCDADPENGRAFEGMQALWQKASAAPLQPVAAQLLLPEEKPRIPWRAATARWAMAAVLAGLTLVSAYWLWSPRDGASVPVLAAQGGEAMSPTGQSREFALPDGSRVTLGGATRISTAYTARHRSVRLERGEAYFKVEKNRQLPFVVESFGARITAVGTAFNVRTDGGSLRVTVTEGAVDVRPATGAAGSSKAVRLSAGEQVTLEGAGSARSDPPRISAVDPKVAVAWTTGTLKFMDEPLDSVVAAVNRYSPGSIEVRGEQVAELRYTGTVVSNRIDEWLAALPNAFPLEVVQQGSGHARIQSREP
jgi:transmembrane sensor